MHPKLIIFVWLSAVAAGAADLRLPDPDQTRVILEQSVSDTRSNICVVFFTAHPQGTSTGNPIRYGFVSATNITHNLLLLRPEFGCRIIARSEDGKLVPRTKLGARYGQKFDALTHWVWDKKKLATKETGSGDPQRPYWTLARHAFPAVLEFPSLDRLFHFPTPGRYTVTISFKIAAYSYGTRLSQASLVELPPVSFDALKREH